MQIVLTFFRLPNQAIFQYNSTSKSKFDLEFQVLKSFISGNVYSLWRGQKNHWSYRICFGLHSKKEINYFTIFVFMSTIKSYRWTFVAGRKYTPLHIGVRGQLPSLSLKTLFEENRLRIHNSFSKSGLLFKKFCIHFNPHKVRLHLSLCLRLDTCLID